MAIKIGKAITRALTPPKAVKDLVKGEVGKLTKGKPENKDELVENIANVILGYIGNIIPKNGSGWKSRKLWVAIIAIIAIALNTVFGNKDNNTVWQIIAIAAAYIVAETAIDIRN